MKNKNAGKLFLELKSRKEIAEFIAENAKYMQIPPLHDYLNELLEKKQYSKAGFIKLSGLDRSYGYHILSGHKKPSRDKLILMAIALQLSLPEVQRLLQYGGYRALYARDVRDGLIIYAVNNRFSISKVNELLHDFAKAILK